MMPDEKTIEPMRTPIGIGALPCDTPGTSKTCLRLLIVATATHGNPRRTLDCAEENRECAEEVLQQVVLNVGPVDVVAEAGQLRDVDHAVLVHGVDGGVEPRRRGVVIDERMQQATFVEAAYGWRQGAHRVEIANATAVDLHLHAERLGKMADFHQR